MRHTEAVRRRLEVTYSCIVINQLVIPHSVLQRKPVTEASLRRDACLAGELDLLTSQPRMKRIVLLMKTDVVHSSCLIPAFKCVCNYCYCAVEQWKGPLRRIRSYSCRVHIHVHVDTDPAGTKFYILSGSQVSITSVIIIRLKVTFFYSYKNFATQDFSPCK